MKTRTSQEGTDVQYRGTTRTYTVHLLGYQVPRRHGIDSLSTNFYETGGGRSEQSSKFQVPSNDQHSNQTSWTKGTVRM